MEHAIKHYIKIHLDEDPEYYKQLSEHLQEIIRQNKEKWNTLVSLLFDFRNEMKTEHEREAKDLGLTPPQEISFYNNSGGKVRGFQKY